MQALDSTVKAFEAVRSKPDGELLDVPQGPVPSETSYASARDRLVALAATAAEQSKGELVAFVHRYTLHNDNGDPSLDTVSSLASTGHVLTWLRSVPSHTPIHLLLHEVQGRLSPIKQIARVLSQHEAKVTVYVPYYVQGNAALLCLAADEIVLGPHAHISMHDTKSFERILASKNKGRKHLSDLELLRLHGAEQTLVEVSTMCCDLLHGGKHGSRCSLGNEVARGQYFDSGALTSRTLSRFGIPVSEDFPAVLFQIVEASETLLRRSGDEEVESTPSQSKKAAGDIPVCIDACPVGALRSHVATLEEVAKAPIINVIHRNAPASRDVDLLTATRVLRALARIPTDAPVGLVLHTGGGNALEGLQIARALKAHRGKKTVYVPFYAYSSGTLIALAADEIVLGNAATLGPIDSQLEISFPPTNATEQFSAAAYASVLKWKRPKHVSDAVLQTALSMRDVSIKQDYQIAEELLSGKYTKSSIRKISDLLCSGKVRHGYPVMYREAKAVGLNVREGLPETASAVVLELLRSNSAYCSVFLCSAAEATST